MLRITKLTDYAVLLLVEMAKAPKVIHSAQALADALDLKLPTTSKLLKMLTKNKLLESIRGTEGGYKIALSSAQIRLSDVIEAIEGRIALTECSLDEGSCHKEQDCKVKKPWQKINAVVSQSMANITLADFTSQSQHQSEVANGK